MAKYQVSAQTRLSLILAAGELFAEKGIEGVTTREIAKRAGTVQNSIAYHFGGISGLIDAVWAYVLIEWEPGRFARYLQEHESLQETLEGKVQLVREGISVLFEILLRPDRPLWISKFLVRSALSEDGRECVARTISGSVVPEMIRLFHKVSGRKDPDEANCWAMRILSAPVVFTANLTSFARFRKGRSINRELYQKLKFITIRDSLFAAGLPTDGIMAEEGEVCK